MGRSCALVSCSCAVSRVTGSLGKSLPLLLRPLVDHSLNYPWPKLFPAAIVKCIQLKPVNSLGVKTNCSFWQTISLLPRISWLCVEWHRSLRARRLFPAAGVGFIWRKSPTFVGREMRELCRQDCTTSPWDSCRYPGLSPWELWALPHSHNKVWPVCLWKWQAENAKLVRTQKRSSESVKGARLKCGSEV